ncbi:hypothetical protein N431DRAFT_389140 [Stipitochalara longipes BDJ]|nr:hypothetical protein N431DRAFT_389140 [Stipitochalara longipes BDJ]
MSPPAPSPSSEVSKPQRVLACVRCQTRKVKCDRRFPCANCIVSHAQCVPATVTPRVRRKRRFPERELLERVRKYEDLLRQNNVKFDPLHKDVAGEKGSPNTHVGDNSDDDHPAVMGKDCPSPATSVKSERVYEAKNFWQAINPGYHDPDESDNSHEDLHEMVCMKNLVQLFGDNDHLLFGSSNTNVDLATLHPEPVHIFRLWQIYLDNVNPLLKVTHTPSLQGLIIEATSNMANISPTLEVLMFSIYCMAILSLVPEDCQAIFGSSAEELLTRFQFGCRQALVNCGFLRSTNRNCLTAFYLYLISVRHRTAPQSLSAMLGVAIRIAQRMGIHSESALTQSTPLEAELRRRLWWSLVLYDNRISEMAEHKISTLAPTWDCKSPLNVSDSDLRVEMKHPPAVQEKPTDSIFAVVRGELGDFVRHTIFHLDFTTPALKPLVPEDAELATVEKMIEDKYLRFCDPENPLHFMTIWWTRSYLGKCRLLEHHSKFSSSTTPQTDAQRDILISIAIDMLECDTKLRSSPLTKPFRWLIHLHFAAPAYIQILQDLRTRPGSELAGQAWEAMSDNFEVTILFIKEDSESPIFMVFSKMILQAWQACEEASTEQLTIPRIVLAVKQRVAEVSQKALETETQQRLVGMEIDSFSPPIPAVGSGNQGLMYNTGLQGGYGPYGQAGPSTYPDISGRNLSSIDPNLLNLGTMDWGLGGVYSGAWNAGL